MPSKSVAPFLIAAGCALLPAARGAAPAQLDAHAIGFTQSALDYCGKIDPVTKVKIEAKLAELQKGAGEDQLARVRKTEAYRQAYNTVAEFTAKIEGERNAHRFCSEPASK